MTRRASPDTFEPGWVRRKDEWLDLPGSERALWFVNGVNDGTIPMCHRIQQACQRFVEMQDVHIWEPDKVDNAVKTIEGMECPEGVGFGRFIVLPWQAMMIAVAYGFKGQDGKRGFQEILLVVPRKAGKSSIVAAIVLYEMMMPYGGGKSPCTVITGVNEKIAKHTFNKMRKILNHDKSKYGKKGLVAQAKINIKSKEITFGSNQGEVLLETLGARSLDGYTLTGFVVDEVGSIQDRSGLETLRSGFSTAPHPLKLLTSTPGDIINSALDDELESAIRVLDGDDSRPRYFPLIFRAEEEDKPQAGDPELWEKVQPSLGYSVQAAFYDDEWRKAAPFEDLKHKFYTRQLCAPSVPSGIWITSDQWLKSPDPGEIDKAKADRWFIGLDLSDVKDMTAICVLGVDTKREVARCWFECHTAAANIPDDDSGGRQRAQLLEWSQGNHLVIHQGSAIDHLVIADRIKELAKQVNPISIMADTYSAIIQVHALLPGYLRARVGYMNQTGRAMANPLNMISSMMERGNLHMQNHPVAIQHLKNAMVEVNDFGGRVIKKSNKNSRDFIDSIDALQMAFAGYAETYNDKLAGTKMNPLKTAGETIPGRPDDEGKPTTPIRLC